ncbi:hypothetical protein KKF84_15140 [Myxococcota bacterium]|nr:hypothetical protein [Myxococcota bacterium]
MMFQLLLTCHLLFAAPVPAENPGLVIVTTQRIKARSAMLKSFVAEKEAHGFMVEVITEEQYGGPEDRGEARALAIRSYLQSIEADFSFALLIGDADPEYGDVPQWVVWPRHTYPANECVGFALDCRSCLTDYLYADLTGDWDLSGNGQRGETALDEGIGGIDFGAELFVGRIPVYFNDVMELDQILENTIAFMNQDAAEAAYRERALIGASFWYFKGQKMTSYTLAEHVDGSDIGEWFVHNTLAPYPEVTVTKLYETQGAATSPYGAEQLTREAFIQEWATGYGMVFWMAHGLETKILRTTWPADTDADGLADNGEIVATDMLRSSDATLIGTDCPAFVVGVSCEMGSAEVPGNLAWSLLYANAAIGVVGSSSTTPASAMEWSDFDAPLEEETIGAGSVGVRFYESLLGGEYAGKAFYDAKMALGSEGKIEAMAGKMMLNYMGDPSLTIHVTRADRAPLPENTTTGGGSGCSTAPHSSQRDALLPMVLLLLGLAAFRMRNCQ